MYQVPFCHTKSWIESGRVDVNGIDGIAKKSSSVLNNKTTKLCSVQHEAFFIAISFGTTVLSK